MIFIHNAFAGVITDATPFSAVVLNVVYFLLLSVGGTAIMSVLFAGILYLTAGGNEEQIKRAKKALIASIVGIAVALAALVLVKIIGGFFSL